MEYTQNINSLALIHIGNFVKSLYGHANQLLRQHGFMIRLEQLPVIMTVHYFGTLYQQEIADMVGRDKSSVQRTVAFLQKNELIHITEDRNDRRRNMVSLTFPGKDLARRLHDELMRLEQVLFSHVDEKDKTALIGIIRKAEHTIDQAVSMA